MLAYLYYYLLCYALDTALEHFTYPSSFNSHNPITIPILELRKLRHRGKVVFLSSCHCVSDGGQAS